MVARKIKRKAVTKRQGIAAALIGIVTMGLVYGLVALAVTPVKYDLRTGDAAPATITAKQDIEDTITTDALIAAAVDAVQPVQSRDELITKSVKDMVSGFFDGMIPAAQYVKEQYIDQEIRNSIYSISRETLEQQYDPGVINWQLYLDEAQLSTVRTMTDSKLSDTMLFAMAALSENEILSIKSDVLNILDNALSAGISAEQLEAKKNSVSLEITNIAKDAGTAELLSYPVKKYLKTNLVFDEEATEQAKLNAKLSVKPAMYLKGQTVVVEGETVTEAQMKVLSDLGVIGGEDVDYKLYIGMLLFVLVLFGVYAVYLYQFESETVNEIRKLLVLASIIVVVAAVSVPLARLDSRILPSLYGIMLASVLVSRRNALALGILLAFIIGVICSWDSGLVSETMLKTVLMTAAGGSAAVFILYKLGHRTTLIFAGLAAGLVNVLIAAAMHMAGSAEIAWDRLWLEVVYALGSVLLCAVLVIGTLPVWEAVFGIATPTKLLELSNSNHPLLKRLMIEAPGTYHHSMMTANLAEAGADAIGANALLCRVGSYFHDAGKLENPMYFKENQKGENPHDELAPQKSAKIITDHLAKGLEYAQKYKLPREVQRIISQHHGDGYVEYFLYKAKQTGGETNDAAFRYAGNKPSTKESAVVMLADTVEAAVRSMENPDKQQIKEMINGLVKKRYNDGQLDECPLNRRDLNTIAKAFLSAFEGALHGRVKYPGQKL